MYDVLLSCRQHCYTVQVSDVTRAERGSCPNQIEKTPCIRLRPIFLPVDVLCCLVCGWHWLQRQFEPTGAFGVPFERVSVASAGWRCLLLRWSAYIAPVRA
jgi:hypothetical protein